MNILIQIEKNLAYHTSDEFISENRPKRPLILFISIHQIGSPFM